MDDVAVAAWNELSDSFDKLRDQMSQKEPNVELALLYSKAVFADAHHLTEKIRGSTSRTSD